MFSLLHQCTVIITYLHSQRTGQFVLKEVVEHTNKVTYGSTSTQLCFWGFRNRFKVGLYAHLNYFSWNKCLSLNFNRRHYFASTANWVSFYSWKTAEQLMLPSSPNLYRSWHSTRKLSVDSGFLNDRTFHWNCLLGICFLLESARSWLFIWSRAAFWVMVRIEMLSHSTRWWTANNV